MSLLGSSPEVRDGIALGQEAEKEGRAAGKDDGSDRHNAPSKVAHDEDAPVKEEDSNLDDCYSECPRHHKDIYVLDWSAGKYERECGTYDLKFSILRSFQVVTMNPRTIDDTLWS